MRGQPVGLRDSSRGLSAAIPPDRRQIFVDPERVTEFGLAPPPGCETLIDQFRGLSAAIPPDRRQIFVDPERVTEFGLAPPPGCET